MKVRADFPIRMRISVTAALRSTHRALQVQAEVCLRRAHRGLPGVHINPSYHGLFLLNNIG